MRRKLSLRTHLTIIVHFGNPLSFRLRPRNICLAVLLASLSLTISGCAKRRSVNSLPHTAFGSLGAALVDREKTGNPAGSSTGSSETGWFSLEESLQELKELKAPLGMSQELFTDIKGELERLLEERGAGSGRVAGLPEAGIRVSSAHQGLSWNEVRQGDYNNDGAVKADDIVPLAIHLGKNDDPQSPNYYKYTGYVDGDGDGVIGIGDVQAIADRFGESTIGYNIYEALDSSGSGMSKVATILRPSPPQDPDNPPWNISFATLEYDTSSGTSLPSSLRQVAGGSRTAPTVLTSGASSVVASEAKQSLTIPPNWSPTPGKFYSVVPYGQGFDEQGEPIFVERFNLASNWAYVNIPPVVIFKADPDTGEAPVTVTFDARDSYDADGYITNYLWDFDGDGLTDTITQTPITTYEFTGPSVKPASLLVYDNAGWSSAVSPLPLHIAGFLWEQVPIGVSGLHLTILNGDITLAGVRENNIVLVRKKNNQWEEEKVVEAPPPVGGGNSPSVVGVSILEDGRTVLAWQDKDFHIQFAVYDNGRWSNSIWIYDSAQAPNMALSKKGILGVIYYDMKEDLLKYFSWDGIEKKTEVVDEEVYAGRYGSSLAFNGNGDPVVVFRTTQDPSFFLSTKVGTLWERELILAGNTVGMAPRVVVGWDETPYVASLDAEYYLSQVWLSWKRNGSWQTVLLDDYGLPVGTGFSRPEIQVVHDTVYIAYAESGSSPLPPSEGVFKIVRFTEGQWTILKAKKPGLALYSPPSLSLDVDDLPIAALYGSSVDLGASGIYLVTRVE